MTDRPSINIEVPVLTRVEGEGALELSIKAGAIDKLQLRIFEPPRLFEKLLEGRPYTDVVDIVARICGICPVAYQMSAVHALEAVFDLEPGPWIRNMRRLMYCGEWIESHALHIHLLAMPDYLGYNDVIALADDYPDQVRRGLQLQALGNRVLRLLGGRSVHPVGVCVGGFYSAPAEQAVTDLLEAFKIALPDAAELVRWVASLPLPQEEQEFNSVALRHDDEYPFNQGRLVSASGLDINIDQYQQHFRETQVPYSTALHSYLNGKPYLVGPLARLNLNHDRLPESVTQLMVEYNISFPSRNMFHSIIARAIEIYYAMFEAIQIMENYTAPVSSRVEVTVKAGTGYGCTEAPRGLLWHRYQLDKEGNVTSAVIVPPTSQNQARIEQDLTSSLHHFGLDKEESEIRQHCERLIRNYDPCISCSTHFLKFNMERR